MNRNTIIHARGVTKHFERGNIQALRGIDLNISKGEFVAIMGPSGCGKSTLLDLIAGLDIPTAGSITVAGEAIGEHPDAARFRSHTIGIVFQLHNLIPSLTARENVEIPMIGTKRTRRERKEKAEQMLHAVGLGNRLANKPGELSGGERQRVAVARAMANDPPIILADEPTGSLDSEHGNTVMMQLAGLHQRNGTTIVLVTHDGEIARRAGRIVSMKDGKIVP